MKYITTSNGVPCEVEIERDGTLRVNGEARSIDFLASGDPSMFSIIMDNVSHEVLGEEREGVFEVLVHGRLFTGVVADERAQLLPTRRSGPAVESGEISIRAPMRGLVVAVPVVEGQEVKA